MNTNERFRGALLGLATGDAMGTTLEFEPPDTFSPIRAMLGGGPFRLKPGEWTDDTSMALCLGTSLVECRGFDPRDQMQRYLRWRDEGYLSSNGRCFDIGTTCSSALSQFEHSGEPFSGTTGSQRAGNGCIMRLAPIPLAFANDPVLAIQRAADSSRTTHGAATCIDACRYFGGLLVAAVNGVSKEVLMSSNFSPVPGLWEQSPLHPKIAAIAEGSFKRRNPPDIRGTGYVVQSLEAALWAFWNSDNFHDGCLKAVNLGDDADTTGAVYGQIGGAYYGESGIPEEWREKLAKRQTIEELADRLFALAFERTPG
ncbi:MAG: ADP-ribosylglycohydrolase family protein [Verrucomicrobiota bacterium]